VEAHYKWPKRSVKLSFRFLAFSTPCAGNAASTIG